MLESRYIDCFVLGLSAQIRISATSLEVQLYSDADEPFDYNPFVELPFDLPIDSENVRILLADGRVIELIIEGTMIDSTIASFMYSMEFINPADVASIDFYGNEIMVLD